MGNSKVTSEGNNQQIMERLIQSCVDGILAFDTRTRYLIWNPAMERISGIAADDCLGRVATEVFPFMQHTGLDQFHRATLAGKTIVVEDHPYKVPESGKQGAMDCRYSPILDADGAVVGGMGVVRDVTERKAVQDEAERSRRELRYLTARLQEMLKDDRRRMARQVRDGPGKALATLKEDLSDLGHRLQGQQELEDRIQAMTGVVDAALIDVERMTAGPRKRLGQRSRCRLIRSRTWSLPSPKGPSFSIFMEVSAAAQRQAQAGG